jgi:peptidoglycan/LPS O-acetylase OafA/YrhL
LGRTCDIAGTRLVPASAIVAGMNVVERGAVEPATGAGGRVAALDGLRGLAILGVLLFHTGHLAGGFLGVDLFFALSGYLITGLLLREAAATGSVSLIAFWGRRVRRLLPALAVMLAGVTPLVWALGSPDMLRTTLSDGPWVQANLVNWHLLAEESGYWDRFGEARVYEHLWSIAVEEQFYLVWPVAVLLMAWWGGQGRRGRPGRGVDGRTAAAAILISVVSLAAMIALADPADPTRVYTGTDTRAFSLLLGALVATRPVRDRLAAAIGGPLSAGVVPALFAAGIGTAWLLADGTDSGLFTGGLFLHSLAAALLIGLCAQTPHSMLARVLAWQPLRRLGHISYSLYLWHWPVIVLFSPERTGLDGWFWTAAVSTVCIGLATLSTYLIENPIRFHSRWARGRSGLAAFVAVMAGLALLWTLAPAPAPVTIDVTDLG